MTAARRLPCDPLHCCTWILTAAMSVVLARDVVVVARAMGVWERLYTPVAAAWKVPVVVYFHGGGFCVGSAAWSCYHEFLAQLPARTACVVMSVDYRLEPENHVPAAFDLRRLARGGAAAGGVPDGRQRGHRHRVHIAARLGEGQLGALAKLTDKGAILIQRFFGGPPPQRPQSALSLSTSDSYWRMALPAGAGRDHPWFNPLSRGAPRMDTLPLPPVLVCVAEAGILRDRT